MADPVAEPQTATTEKPTEAATNGSSEKSADAPTNSAEVSEKKESDAKRGADEDDFERYDNDKTDRRDRRDKDDRRGGDRRNGRDGDRRGGGRGRAGRGGRGGGRGRGDFNRFNRKDNIRTKYERQEESSDATEIRRQVEFYFSDSNLPIDRFLLEETGGSENKWFPLKTIHNFKRMRHFQPFSVVVEAVKGSDLLEVNDKDEVRRKAPLDSKFTTDVKTNGELLTSDSMKRSIYAKGFGEEIGSTAFDIEEFFNPYGANAVRLRRSEDGTFKGSVFVEFASEDDAQQFLDMEEKPKYKDTELEVMSKKAYVDMKSEAILDGRVKPKSPTRSGFRSGNDRRDDRRGGRGGGRGRGRRSSFDYGNNKRKRDGGDDDVEDKNDWRSRRDKFQKQDRRSESRSRSRSPYRAEKKEEDNDSSSKDEVKKESAETKTEEKKDSAPEETTTTQPESSEAAEVKADA